MAGADEETKSQEHYFIHKACTKDWLRIIIALVGVGIWLVCSSSTHKVTGSPEAWPAWANIVYFGLTKSLFAFGGFLIVFATFFSPNSFMKAIMRRPIFRLGGSLCFLGSLITPMCIY